MARPKSAVLVHGTVRGYNYHRCRCPECRQAWSEYSKKHYQPERAKQRARKKQEQGLCRYCGARRSYLKQTKTGKPIFDKCKPCYDRIEKYHESVSASPPKPPHIKAPKCDEGKNPLAVALGRLGGLKGGHARAARMTAEERSESARKAARARWGDWWDEEG